MKRMLLVCLVAVACQRSTEFTIHYPTARGLMVDTPVIRDGQNIGKVVEVLPAGGGTDIRVEIPAGTVVLRESLFIADEVSGALRIVVRDVGESRTAIRAGEVVEGTEPIEFVVRFGNVHGIAKGAPVTYRGVIIGEVTGVSVTDTGVNIRVKAVPYRNMHLYKEARFTVEQADGAPRLVISGEGQTIVRAGDLIHGTDPLMDKVREVGGALAGGVSRAIDAVTK